MIGSFISTANRERDNALKIFDELDRCIQYAEHQTVGKLENTRDDLVKIFDRAIDEMQAHYDYCREWVEQRRAEHAVNEIREHLQLSTDIINNIGFKCPPCRDVKSWFMEVIDMETETDGILCKTYAEDESEKIEEAATKAKLRLSQFE